MDLTSQPADVLLALRRADSTRDAAMAELRRRITHEGPRHTSPDTLGPALGIAPRTLRRVLDDLDAVDPVPVGWSRTKGHAGGDARKRTTGSP